MNVFIEEIRKLFPIRNRDAFQVIYQRGRCDNEMTLQESFVKIRSIRFTVETQQGITCKA